MCKECDAEKCKCDCVFEEVPTADILSGPFVEVCSECGHERDIYGDY
jgi:hypothetical protein